MYAYTEEEYREESLTKKQVVFQIRKHHLDPCEFFEEVGIKQRYNGGVLLNWLGY
tara:strand:- start:244 stop:408 length:165 start_codon:yes stop_codon:yes gene_type:complete